MATGCYLIATVRVGSPGAARSFVRRFRSRFHSSASVRSLPFARVDRVVAACRRRGSSSPSTRKRRGDRGARNLSGDSRETGINGQLHKYNV